jgi:hypothetical protein
MQGYSMRKNNGILDGNSDFNCEFSADPQFVFLSKQRYTNLLSDIGECLQSLPYALIKGEALSNLAYRKFGVRYFSDIDILLPRYWVRQLETALITHEYSMDSNTLDDYRYQRVLCLSSSHQLKPYRKTVKGLNLEVDINFDLFWGEYDGKRIDVSDFLSDAIEMEVYGCCVKTLPPLKAIIQLVLHHYKEMNSIYHLAGHNCIKHSMFQDVYYLWKSNQDAISLDNLYSLASAYEIVPFVYYVLFFTNWIFKDYTLRKYIDAFETPQSVELLHYYGLTEKERRPWKIDFQARLTTENLYEAIKEDLTEDDVDKLKRNRWIFG